MLARTGRQPANVPQDVRVHERTPGVHGRPKQRRRAESGGGKRRVRLPHGVNVDRVRGGEAVLAHAGRRHAGHQRLRNCFASK